MDALKQSDSSFLGKCIDFGLNNKMWVILFSLALVSFSIYKLPDLSVDAVPDITNIQVVVNTKTQGLDPSRVELMVTQPIEFEMVGLPKLEDMRSISKYGLSQVILVFKDGTDIYWARQQVAEKIQNVSGVLPTGIVPEMAPITTGLGEVFMYTLSLNEKSDYFQKTKEEQLQYLREVQDYIVRPHMRRIKDVADVDTNGGFKKELHINLNPEKMTKFGLTIKSIMDKLIGIGQSFGGGVITQNDHAVIIRASTNLNAAKDIELISVAQKYDGSNVLLKDIATVSFDSAPRVGGATYDGKESVLGTVLMQSGGNGRLVSIEAEKVFKEIDLPEGIETHILYNRSFLVGNTLKTVIKNLIEGALLVIAILLIVLGHWRAALLVALIIPLSMFGTNIGMQELGISGNLMSLGAIDFGLVVDGAVVLIENLISRHNSLTPEQRKIWSKDHIVSLSSKEVVRPVVFGLLMIMIVYIPVLTLEGVEGKMFRPMAYTVLLTLGCALVLTIFLIPVLASLFIPLPKESSGHDDHDTKFFKLLKKFYVPFLNKSFDHPKFLLGGGVAGLLVALFLFTRLGADFIPQLDEGDIVINITRDAKISLDKAIEQQELVEKKIVSVPEVESVFSRLGTPESATDPMGVHLADTFIILKKDRDLWRFKTKDEVLAAIKKEIDSLNFEAELSSTQPIEMRFNEMLEGSRADVSLRIIGNDLAYMVEKIDQVQKEIEDIAGLEGAEMDPLTALRQSDVIDIHPRFDQLSKLGVPLDELNLAIVGFMQGNIAGVWTEGIRKYPIVVHLAEEKRENPDELRALPIPLPDGGSVPLSDVAHINKESQVTTIARNWGERYAALSINIGNRDTLSFVADAMKKVSKVELKADHSYRWGGQFNNLERAKKKLWIIIPLTLAIIFFILWRQFHSLLDAFTIFSAIPFASIGGIVALWARDIHLSLSAAVGFIALIGIALLNGIVLITVFRQMRETHPEKSWEEIVEEGTVSRLRPVIMTALVAALGFIPMALNTGLGAEVQRPLATVVIGGIVFSTVLTLLLLPTFYLMLHRGRRGV
ncbi:MAG: efflux RND transporter permease subunit [Bacteriovoracaceae bacterium]